jgi:hypothetical protein
MLPLLVSCFVAYGVAEAMGNLPIYESLRLRSGGQRPGPGTASPDPAAQA